MNQSKYGLKALHVAQAYLLPSSLYTIQAKVLYCAILNYSVSRCTNARLTAVTRPGPNTTPTALP